MIIQKPSYIALRIKSSPPTPIKHKSPHLRADAQTSKLVLHHLAWPHSFASLPCTCLNFSHQDSSPPLLLLLWNPSLKTQFWCHLLSEVFLNSLLLSDSLQSSPVCLSQTLLSKLTSQKCFLRFLHLTWLSLWLKPRVPRVKLCLFKIEIESVYNVTVVSDM